MSEKTQYGMQEPTLCFRQWPAECGMLLDDEANTAADEVHDDDVRDHDDDHGDPEDDDDHDGDANYGGEGAGGNAGCEYGVDGDRGAGDHCVVMILATALIVVRILITRVVKIV